MHTPSDQLFGFGDNFIDVVLMLEEGGLQKHSHFFFCISYTKLLTVSSYLRDGTVIYNTEGENVSDTSYVLLVDATMYNLSEEHLPYIIFAIYYLGFLISTSTLADFLLLYLQVSQLQPQ